MGEKSSPAEDPRLIKSRGSPGMPLGWASSLASGRGYVAIRVTVSAQVNLKLAKIECAHGRLH